uniref:RNA helicase n=1 Tax=Syphacia muris TaxID=451379 RepID=A0A158R4U7_9BILA
MVIRSNEVAKNCFTPRDYQVELLDRACKANVIIPLGTGFEKTFIAVLLIKEYTAVLTDSSNNKKKAFFLVNKVSLVEQQASHVECHTVLRVGRLHGGRNTSATSDGISFQKFVIVSTAQSFLNIIDQGFFNLSDVVLLIVDECHHALGSGHPYRLIMQHYSKLQIGNRPRILGLTASLATHPKKLRQLITNFEFIMCSSLITSSDLVSIAKYSVRPEEYVIICENFDPKKWEENVILIQTLFHCYLPKYMIVLYFLVFHTSCFFFSETLHAFCVSSKEFEAEYEIDPRKPVLEAVNRTLSVLKQMGSWCAWKVCQLFQKQLRKHAAQTMLPEKQVKFLLMGETTMYKARNLLDKKMLGLKNLNDFKHYLPSKVSRLLEILQFFSPVNNPNFVFCGIVFVEQRYVSYVMNILIKAVAKFDKDRFGYLMPDFVIGYKNSNFGTEETLALHKRQEEVLKKFRHGQVNLLIATSVLEEGIDIKQCNVVIRFDRPLDYRAYIQSRGRAKKERAKYFILTEESEYVQCIENLQEFVETEEILLERCHAVHNPPEEPILDSNYNIDDLIPPYEIPSTGAKVTMSTAIGLVNRYCAKLPSDIFTRLVPQNMIIPKKVGDVTMYLAELSLPINSPIKHTIKLTKPLPTKKLAQMAVALETCKRLHEAKELDDNLLPVGKDTITLNALDDDPDEYIPNMKAKVGSARRKQLYDRKMAKALHNALPEPNSYCFVYVMEMELIKAVSGYANPKNRKVTNPLDSEFCFGFLSKKRIPPIPSFPVFLRQGHMQANVLLRKTMLYVDSNMLEHLKAFHRYIFDDVLRLYKSGLAFVPEKASVSTLIVPLKREKSSEDGCVDFTLDFDYVCKVVKSVESIPHVPSEEERKNFQFDYNKFRDAVVMPWYRDIDRPVFYYVAEILNDETPSSKFPDEKFLDFNEYFEQKYNITIYNQRQPLLDVDYTSGRLNLVMPRHTCRLKRLGMDSKTGQSSAHGQILIPELVDVHPIAASLWNVIAALPTLLYRVNSLLLADELRQTILKEALNSDAEVPEDYSWPPLNYPTSFDDVNTKPINKIQHLKREQLVGHFSHDEKVANEKESSDEIDSKDDTNSFEIGIWDPELAKGLMDVVQEPQINTNMEDFEADTVGLMSTSGILRQRGDMSDDEDDDAVMLFDFMHTVHERCAKEQKDLFAPTKDIEAAGWDTIEVCEEHAPVGTNMPLSMNIGNSMGIDSRALLADLSTMRWETNLMGSCTRNDTFYSNSVDKEEVSSNNNNEGGPKRCDLGNVKKPVQLYLNYIERLEDNDREAYVKVEESVDLFQYVDNDSKFIDKPFSTTVVPYNCYLPFDNTDGRNLRHIRVINPSDISASLVILKRDARNTDRSTMNNKTQFETSDDELEMDLRQEIDNQRSATQKYGPERCSVENDISVEPLTWMTFSFEKDASSEHPYGVSPCTLLQALTMCNASDGINLERLETVGDSFLKYAVTDYLFQKNPNQHEGKLSFARSKEVSNCNLYRLGKKRHLPSIMIGTKFDPNDSWLPPCYAPTTDFKAPNSLDAEECDQLMEDVLEGKGALEQVEKEKTCTGWDEGDMSREVRKVEDGIETIMFPKSEKNWDKDDEITPLPYNMLTQQNLSDKSIADAVEALIGAHLLELGPTAALKFMKWLGLKVLTKEELGTPEIPIFKFIDTPEQPNLSECKLNELWAQFRFAQVEEAINYKFKQKAYLLQAFTHASYYKNRITGCYQRLEFLGDAVLDYLITRFLYQHPRQYSPGVLTDLRSALVNNTIFASLAVKYNFHKHFVAMCPGLYHMIEKFVRLCNEKNLAKTNFNAEMYMVTTEEEIDEGEEEDIEVPKAMGDIFESVAGAVYLDCGKNLDTVWCVFYNLMKETIDECCDDPPKSPIRELLELEPDRARFSKLERILETGKVRVTVEIQKKCRFTGMGRSYRIAKCTAAKRALRYLKRLEKEKERAAAKALETEINAA